MSSVISIQAGRKSLPQWRSTVQDAELMGSDATFLARNPEVASKLGLRIDEIRERLFKELKFPQTSGRILDERKRVRGLGIAIFARKALDSKEIQWEKEWPFFAALVLEYNEKMQLIIDTS